MAFKNKIHEQPRFGPKIMENICKLWGPTAMIADRSPNSSDVGLSWVSNQWWEWGLPSLSQVHRSAYWKWFQIVIPPLVLGPFFMSETDGRTCTSNHFHVSSNHFVLNKCCWPNDLISASIDCWVADWTWPTGVKNQENQFIKRPPHRSKQWRSASNIRKIVLPICTKKVNDHAFKSLATCFFPRRSHQHTTFFRKFLNPFVLLAFVKHVVLSVLVDFALPVVGWQLVMRWNGTLDPSCPSCMVSL